MLAIVPDQSMLTVMPRAVTPVLTSTRHGQEQLFSNYASHASQLQRMSSGIDAFVKTVIRQNMGPSASVFMPDFSLRIARPTAELAIRTEPEVRAGLNEGLKRAGTALAQKLKMLFDSLVEQKHVGEIQWFSSTVARFSYATSQHSDALLRQYRERGFRITERERTHVHLLHIHDIVNARRLRLGDRSIAVPARVQPIIQAIPPWLANFAEIVAGDEISSEVHEVGRKKEIIRESEWAGEEITYRRDPALTIGCYVLAGWENGET